MSGKRRPDNFDIREADPGDYFFVDWTGRRELWFRDPLGGSQIRYDLPTRGNLAGALRDMDAAIDRALFDVQVAHDDGCPAIGIGGGCTCELVEVILTRSA